MENKKYTLKIGSETFEVNKAFFEIEQAEQERIKNELSKFYDPNSPKVIKCELIEDEKHNIYQSLLNIATLIPNSPKVIIKMPFGFFKRKKRITKKRIKNITQLIKFN